MASHPRRIWLCADDYGVAPGVSAAIRELISRGRINATSIMVAAAHFNSEEAAALATLNSGEKRAALGLHVTLTGPLQPMSANFSPLRRGRFLPLNAMLRMATARRLQPEPLANEIAAQLKKFIHVFGRPPDFLDGHQHIQLFPQVRDAFLKVVAERTPTAWVRQCGRVAGELRQVVPALSVRPAGWRPDHVSPGCRRYRAKRPGFADNPARTGICLLWFRCFFKGPCRA
jgi:predicted glycoside hydrolase/deacetylase ChbG (UPF0249 family)